MVSVAKAGTAQGDEIELHQSTLEELAELRSALQRIESAAAWRSEQIRIWARTGYADGIEEDPELARIDRGLDGLVRSVIDSAQRNPRDPVGTFMQEQRELRRGMQTSDDPSPPSSRERMTDAAEILVRYVEIPGHRENVLTQLLPQAPVGSAALVEPVLRDAIARTLLDQTEEAATLARARAYARYGSGLAQALGSPGTFRRLRDAVEALDAEVPKLEPNETTALGGPSGSDEALAGVLAKLLREREAQHMVVRERLQASLARVESSATLRSLTREGTFDQRIMEFLEVCGRAELLVGLTEVSPAWSFESASGLLHEIRGIGVSVLLESAAVATSPRPPVILIAGADGVQAHRDGLGEHMLLIPVRAMTEGRRVWRELDLGLRTPRVRWTLEDDRAVISEHLPRFYIENAVLSASLHELGLPTYVEVMEASAGFGENGVELRVRTRLRDVVAGADAVNELVIDDHLLADTARVRSVLEHYGRRSLGVALSDARYPSRAADLFPGIAPLVGDSRVHGAWIKSENPTTLSVWMTTPRGWPIRATFTRRDRGLEMTEIDADPGLASAITTMRLSPSQADRGNEILRHTESAMIASIELADRLTPRLINRMRTPLSAIAVPVPEPWLLHGIIAEAASATLATAQHTSAPSEDSASKGSIREDFRDRLTIAVTADIRARWSKSTADELAAILSESLDEHIKSSLRSIVLRDETKAFKDFRITLRERVNGFADELPSQWLDACKEKKEKTAKDQDGDPELCAVLRERHREVVQHICDELLVRLVSDPNGGPSLPENDRWGDLAEFVVRQWLSGISATSSDLSVTFWKEASSGDDTWQRRFERSISSIKDSPQFVDIISLESDVWRLTDDAVERILRSFLQSSRYRLALNDLLDESDSSVARALGHYIEHVLCSPSVTRALISGDLNGCESLSWDAGKGSRLEALSRALNNELRMPPQTDERPGEIARIHAALLGWLDEVVGEELKAVEVVIKLSSEDVPRLPEGMVVPFPDLSARLEWTGSDVQVMLSGSVIPRYSESGDQAVPINIPLPILASKDSRERSRDLAEAFRKRASSQTGEVEPGRTDTEPDVKETAEGAHFPVWSRPISSDPIDVAAWVLLNEGARREIEAIRDDVADRLSSSLNTSAARLRRDIELALLEEVKSDGEEARRVIEGVTEVAGLIAAAESSLALIEDYDSRFESFLDVAFDRTTHDALKRVIGEAEESKLLDSDTAKDLRMRVAEAFELPDTARMRDLVIEARDAVTRAKRPIEVGLLQLLATANGQELRQAIVDVRKSLPAGLLRGLETSDFVVPETIDDLREFLDAPQEIAAREARRIQLIGEAWFESQVIGGLEDRARSLRDRASLLRQAAAVEAAWLEPGSEARRRLILAARDLREEISEISSEIPTPVLDEIVTIDFLDRAIQDARVLQDGVADRVKSLESLERELGQLRGSFDEFVSKAEIAFRTSREPTSWAALAGATTALREGLTRFSANHLGGVGAKQLTEPLEEFEKWIDSVGGAMSVVAEAVSGARARAIAVIGEATKGFLSLSRDAATAAEAAQEDIEALSEEVDRLIATKDPMDFAAHFKAVNDRVSALSDRFGIEASGLTNASAALAGATDTMSVFAADAAGVAEVLASIPEALSADLASDLFEPRVAVKWNPDKGKLDLNTTFGALGDTKLEGVLKDPRLRDSALVDSVSDWVNMQFKDTELNLVKSFDEEMKQFEKNNIGRVNDFASRVRDDLTGGLVGLREQLPKTLNFIGLHLDVEYTDAWGVAVVHNPAPSSRIPRFRAEGLVVLDVDLEAGLDEQKFKLTLNPSGRVKFGSLRPALESILADVVPAGLTLTEDPELYDRTLRIPFRYQPSGLPMALYGEIVVDDLRKFTVDVDAEGLARAVRDLVLTEVYSALKTALEERIASGDAPGIGPVVLDKNRPIARLDGVVENDANSAQRPHELATGEMGLIVGLRLEISDIAEIPLSLIVGFESGFRVHVDPASVAEALGPLLDTVFGDGSLFRLGLATPAFTTEERLTFHLEYELDIPLLGAGLGGELSVSSSGIDLGPGVTLTVPGWVEAPPVAIGAFRATLKPRESTISLSADATLSPGPASVNAMRCRLTGSMTYNKPVVISASGVVTMVRVLELGRSDVRIEPAVGSFGITTQTSSIARGLFKLDGLLQVEADASRNRRVRGESYNVAFQSKTEVLGIQRQTVEGGFDWSARGLLAIEAGIPLSDFEAVLEFKEGFSSPSLRFKGRVADSGDVTNIYVLVVANERIVHVVATASIAGIDFGVDFLLPGLDDLTPGRVVSELLKAFELSLSLDIGFGVSNASDDGPEGEEGAAGEVETEGEEGDAPPPPGGPDRAPVVTTPSGLSWEPMAEQRWEVVGRKKRRKWAVFSSTDYIYDYRYYDINDSQRFGRGSAAQLFHGGYRLANVPGGEFSLVVNASGDLWVFDSTTARELWRGLTSRDPVGDPALSLNLLPVMPILSNPSDAASVPIAMVFTGYTLPGGDPESFVAPLRAEIPVDPSKITWQSAGGNVAQLTSTWIDGVLFKDAVTPASFAEFPRHRALAELAASLALNAVEFDSFRSMGDATLIQHNDVRLVYAPRGRPALADFVQGDPKFSRLIPPGENADLIEAMGNEIAQAIQTFEGEPAISSPHQTRNLPMAAAMVHIAEPDQLDPSKDRLLLVGPSRTTVGGAERYVSRLLSPLNDGSFKHTEASVLVAQEKPSAADLARSLASDRDDAVLDEFRRHLGGVFIEPETNITIALRFADLPAKEADLPANELASRPIRRLVASYVADGERRIVFVNRAGSGTEQVLVSVVTLVDVRAHWDRNASAAPPGFAQELADSVDKFCELLVRDDWYQNPEWKADPIGGFPWTASSTETPQP